MTAPAPPTAWTEWTVRTENLGRRFGDRWALADLNLELRAGEVLGLLGPNGAGKTTTVRLLAGLIAPTDGRAWIDGRDVGRDPEGTRGRIGILTESPGLYDKLSAYRNLDFFGQLYRLAPDVRRERIERLLTMLDLWDRRDEPAGGFSKGMKQKLAIARALLHEPSVLFLDEPTAGLDPEAARVVRDAIAILRGSGRTIILCTHNLDEADRLCDRIAFLRTRLLRVDTPEHLRREAAGPGVTVRLAGPAGDALVAAVAALPSVLGAEARDSTLSIGLADPRRDTPDLVRGLVGVGADVLEVRERAASLEEVYFEIMGVRAGPLGETI